MKFYHNLSLRDNNKVVFFDTANTQSVTFAGPATLTSSFTLTLPDSIVANGFLRTDSAGNLTFIVLNSSHIMDFVEAAQDAVGTILTDSSSIDFTYNDSADTITATVIPSGVDHNSLSNYVANEHVDHSSVSIATSATSGLSGGGNITTTRNLSVAPNLATLKTTPVGADELLIADSEASSALKKVTAQSIVNILGLSKYKEDWVTADGTTKTITHSLGTRDVIVQVYDKTDYSTILVDNIERTTVNSVTLTSTEAPPSGGWRVLVLAL